jgi:hypothetical protein
MACEIVRLKLPHSFFFFQAASLLFAFIIYKEGKP